MARISKANLPHLKASEWQYFQGGDGTQDGAWADGPSGLASATPLASPGNLSNIVFLKELGLFYMTAQGTHSIDHAWAHHPWGPWTVFFGENFSWATAGTFPTPILATARLVSSNPPHLQITVAATRYDHNDYHPGGTTAYLLMDLTASHPPSRGSIPRPR